MVSVPTSRRCQRCKRHKRKCDKDWPTCSPCKHAGVICSGPPQAKFVNSGHNKDATVAGTIPVRETRQTKGNTPELKIVDIVHQHMPGGAAFGLLRLSSDKPGKNLTTTAERISARLVGLLNAENARWDPLTAASDFLNLLPSRLSQSAALRDSVALTCSSWSNYRRNRPADRMIDPVLYGKALRSIQSALDGPLYCTSETLAAVTMLERHEFLFDVDRPAHRLRHSRGVETLIRKRGIPRLEDDLDVQMLLMQQETLISLWVTDGGYNFLLDPQWASFFSKALIKIASVSKERYDILRIGRYYAYWPDLIHKFQSVARLTDPHERLSQATVLRQEIWMINSKVTVLGESIYQHARSSGRVKEVLDPDSPIGTKFIFETLETMSCLASYFLLRIILARILQQAESLIGNSDSAQDDEHQDLYSQCWKFIPSILELENITIIYFVSFLYVAYEGAKEQTIKDYLLDVIVDIGERRGRTIGDRKRTEKFVLNTARAATGRVDFTTDLRSEET